MIPRRTTMITELRTTSDQELGATVKAVNRPTATTATTATTAITAPTATNDRDEVPLHKLLKHQVYDEQDLVREV